MTLFNQLINKLEELNINHVVTQGIIFTEKHRITALKSKHVIIMDNKTEEFISTGSLNKAIKEVK